MKLAPVLVVMFAMLAACGGSPKPTPEPSPTTTTTTSASADTPRTGPDAPPPATTLGGPSASTSAPTPAATPPRTAAAGPASAATPRRAAYSCFSYSQRGSTTKRSACMRTDECGPYLDQAKSVGGIVEVSGCANVDQLFCFHQAATKTDPQGLDVCQPTLDTCKSERALLVKQGTSVDSDCAPR